MKIVKNTAERMVLAAPLLFGSMEFFDGLFDAVVLDFHRRSSQILPLPIRFSRHHWTAAVLNEALKAR
jgi:hypothetical protein